MMLVSSITEQKQGLFEDCTVDRESGGTELEATRKVPPERRSALIQLFSSCSVIMSDEELETSQHDVFLKFYSTERHRIFRFIFALIPIEADAEDVFQQTSITLWTKFSDFDQSRDFYPWACGVAYHAVLNFRRSARRSRVYFNDELVSMLADERKRSCQRSRLRQDMLDECLTQLPLKDRNLINQVYMDRSSATKLAQQRGKAVQTIYNRLNIIRAKLLDCVKRKMKA